MRVWIRVQGSGPGSRSGIRVRVRAALCCTSVAHLVPMKPFDECYCGHLYYCVDCVPYCNLLPNTAIRVPSI